MLDVGHGESDRGETRRYTPSSTVSDYSPGYREHTKPTVIINYLAEREGFETSLFLFRIAGNSAELIELPLGDDQFEGLLAPSPIDRVGRPARRDQRGEQDPCI